MCALDDDVSVIGTEENGNDRVAIFHVATKWTPATLPLPGRRIAAHAGDPRAVPEASCNQKRYAHHRSDALPEPTLADPGFAALCRARRSVRAFDGRRLGALVPDPQFGAIAACLLARIAPPEAALTCQHDPNRPFAPNS